MQNKLFRGLLCISILFMFVANAQKPWTFLVYMAAANDLNQFAPLDLQEMMKVGSNDNINVIVYLTLQEDNQPKVTRKLYIQQGTMTQIGADMVRDSGDVATVEEALQWACVDYPSDHIAVVMWNHGSGPLNRKPLLAPKGVCYDFDTNHYLTDRDCLQAFSWASNTLLGGKKFDIIAFDACLLASLEMAYTLSSCADYMVASEETIPGDGYQYAYLLNPFLTTVLDPLSFAQTMVSSYKQEYVGTTDYTLSATDLNAVSALVDNCNIVARILTTQLMGSYKLAVKNIIRKCVNNSISFEQGIYIDLLQFYKNVVTNIGRLKLPTSIRNQLKVILTNGINLFNTIIKGNVASDNYSKVGGLTVYFARTFIDPSYYGLYWTEMNPNWLNFLEAYVA